MKTLKKIWPLLILAALSWLFLTAFQTAGEGSDGPWTAEQWAVLSTFIFPILAQLVRVYRERIGKPIPKWAIELVIFLGAGVMLVFWGDAMQYVKIIWPLTFVDGDLLANIDLVLKFLNSLVFSIGAIYGAVRVYYLALKAALFQWIPALQSGKWAAEKAEERVSPVAWLLG